MSDLKLLWTEVRPGHLEGRFETTKFVILESHLGVTLITSFHEGRMFKAEKAETVDEAMRFARNWVEITPLPAKNLAAARRAK